MTLQIKHRRHLIIWLVLNLILLKTVILASTADDTISAKILEATDQRDATAPAIQSGLISNKVAVQKQAILALGRIGNPHTIKSLSVFLYSPQPEIRALTAYALAISENSTAVPALINRLKSEQSIPVIAELLPALGLLGPNLNSTDIIAVILGYLDHTDSRVVSASCDALSYAWQLHRATISVPNSTQVFKLLSLASKDAEIANHCLYALTRIRTEKALFDDVVHIQKTLDSLTTDYQHLLLTMTLGAQIRPDFIQYYLSHFRPEASADLMAHSAQAIAMLPATENSDSAINMIIEAKAAYLKNDYIRIGLLDGLGQLQPSDRKHRFLQHLTQDSSEWVRSRAIAMLYATDQKSNLSEMLRLFHSERVTTQSMALMVASTFEGPERAIVLAAAEKSAFLSIRDFAKSILSETVDDQTEAVVSESLPFTAIQTKIDKRMLITTTKGNIVIQLLPSAPYTAYNFFQLAVEDHYDGTEFHRVIPGFVVQGGDVKATTTDDPGYRIREELYPVSHLEGTLGMASSGKDTAGAGFFFNLKDNYHLDRRYTVFARVISGMNVVKKLGVGDSIIDVTEYQPHAAK